MPEYQGGTLEAFKGDEKTGARPCPEGLSANSRGSGPGKSRGYASGTRLQISEFMLMSASLHPNMWQGYIGCHRSHRSHQICRGYMEGLAGAHNHARPRASHATVYRLSSCGDDHSLGIGVE
jgi:hypothetical protein